MGTPVRYTNGISTDTPTENLANYGLPNPASWHTYFNDFDAYVAGDWTKTVIGTGDAALAAGDGGWIVLTNSAADNDGVQIQKTPAAFTLAAGKKAIFKAKFKVSDATQSDLAIGLIVVDTTILGSTGGDGVTDGIFFQKDDGSTTLTAYAQKDTTTGQTSATAATLANDTFVTVGWYYDGATSISVFVNDAKVATLDGSSTYFPDTALCPSVALLNGEAVAKSLTVDYIFAAQER